MTTMNATAVIAALRTRSRRGRRGRAGARMSGGRSMTKRRPIAPITTYATTETTVATVASAQVSWMSRSRDARIVSTPSPLCAPVNSPTIAPRNAAGAAICSPAIRYGRLARARTYTRAAPAPRP
ncbi:hypothetical protein QSU92_12955 [Microbacterium sp. ET2]|nr:hypothetical protein [Microbacterium sp. ET2 (Ac-2212)]WJL94863.1 hypothetical protein QSU92_12955 [Microbacterium sp. ET2 (Ac-2212)]